MEESYYPCGPQLLKEPVSYSDLVEKGAEFEVDMSQHHHNPCEEFLGHDSDSDYEDAEDVDNEALRSPWTQSFDELRDLMNKINEHIYKRIIREGHVERDMVPDKARVTVRYSGYWEGEGAPFDSSMLRGTKFEFETGQRKVLEGLEAAVRTMRPYEQAEFIISHKLLFRELGCPPRIKPKADGLFKVEVIDYSLIGDAESIDEIANEDRDKFFVVYPKAQDLHLHGKDCVKRGRFRNAATAFERAVNSLNYCRMANDEEQRRQKDMLITLTQNLMIIYNKLNNPKLTCIMMKSLLRLTENNPSSKALFQEGRALAALGDYDRARRALLQARSKLPENKEINDELISIDKRISKYQEASRDIWTRAFAAKSSQTDRPKTAAELEKEAKEIEFNAEIQDIINEFEKSDRLTMSFSRKMFSDAQFRIICNLVKDRNMKLTLSPIHEDVLTLSKSDRNSN
ncbi:inactive peptidyl-prolyl cis-trans isomerase shutdown [Drosophila eugracilis]|uniref:inactive peptidyl-prolyl cis-trans isomerase shutdown n=1 Tax=Drosophila eugracilis TaxID=29029 RepID=UPI0007E6B75E|nr:inactive peptidyl-prolyl cis-trans isomerase shutdown [Drosophila eugracilis]